ncbi:MAG: Two-component hybrid sensor and regulator [Gemmatimonadetes bacterium]|nr:Two-component hybrid sensor and regulator [Gemmatimonadota bacterium]
MYDRATLRFLEVNEAAVRSYGWSRDEFLGMSIRDIRPPSLQQRLDTQIEEAADDGHHSMQSTHRTKDGRQLRVEISSYPLEFDGHSARMVLVHDVTARERAAEALVRSEEKYRSVIEQLQDVFFRTDTDGLWTFLNPAWTTLTGNAVDASLGKNALSFVYPSDRSAMLDALRSLSSEQVDSTLVEVRMFHSEGGYRWVEASSHIVRDDIGGVVGIMGTLRDITQRRAESEERQRLATNIRQLLDASGEGIYGLDAQGVITFVNQRGAEMLGYQISDLIGQSMHDLTHHSHRDGTPYPKSEGPIHRAAVGGVACEVDDEVMWRKDGGQLLVGYTASPIRENERLSGAVVLVRDITARKRTEQELIVARDAAEAASRAKSDFLARMSHELRTPLNSIIGFAHVLQKNKHGTLKTEETSYLHRISTNGLHLLGLINDILDLSKIEAGRMTLDLSLVSLDTLVRETLDELESQVRERPLVLRAEIAPHVRTILTDGARMKQVLINLIGNAIMFTERGQVIVHLALDPHGHPVQITVRDTGIGIPRDRLAAIFNVFEQAESMTARRFGGTGLGLAISRSLCELMGHSLEVTSVEGQGTTMTITLGETPRTVRLSNPIGINVIPETPRRDNVEVATAPLILVVDDDADSRLLLGQLLEEAGCRVAYATSGLEALSLARDLLPAVIFLDLRLPKISGFDVLRILQADVVLRSTPVIIASVAGTESRSLLSGAADIIDKPITRQHVHDVLTRWVVPA